ncbi:lipopolysaccharide heptosyltransferase II [bacterium]|nr:lipopolysaccharide heptosyltransferase II [FCB group bacterium]MBL7190080.1 lipopolysaccharide heptosyltransferase II [bacterium]
MIKHIKDKVLIFRNQGIGDLILITPAIRAIRHLHPEAHISVFTGDWSKSSVEGNPHIYEIISYPDPWIQNKKLFRILQLTAKLRRKRFDRVYIFHSHDILQLLTLLSGIPERYGFSFEGTGRFIQHKTQWEPNSQRYIADNYLDIPRLAGYNGDDLSLEYYLSQENEAEAEGIISGNDIDKDNFVVIAPGGGINPRQDVFEKRWGADKFARLAELLHEEFDCSIILIGAKAEKEICGIVKNKSAVKVVNLCGETNFKVSAALVKKSKMLISNDSGIMHTAVAFKKPSAAVFGPSNPYSLLPQNNINRWVSSGIDCSPCYCNSIFKGCDRNLACMKELSAEKVFETVKELWIEQYSQIQRSHTVL